MHQQFCSRFTQAEYRGRVQKQKRGSGGVLSLTKNFSVTPTPIFWMSRAWAPLPGVESGDGSGAKEIPSPGAMGARGSVDGSRLEFVWFDGARGDTGGRTRLRSCDGSRSQGPARDLGAVPGLVTGDAE